MHILLVEDDRQTANFLQKGLTELFTYLSIINEYKTNVSENEKQQIIFDAESNKMIEIPTIQFEK